MYHRFNESKYPSTNIDMEIFRKHVEMIKNNNFQFYNPKNFENEFYSKKNDKKILLTIDDAFTSFYKNAWPYLKKNKIPFILFVSTEPVGKKGYMTWEQIYEVEKEPYAFIGNHSHSHEYLVEESFNIFKEDIDRSISIFEDRLGYNPEFFSYPFGEYSLKQKKYIMSKFKSAFGQHSGVIDLNKDKFELPRFPINEKYGDLDRFKFLIKLKPLEYKSISLKDMLVLQKNNPPEVYVEFFDGQKNINNINCYSNEGDGWQNSNTTLQENKLFFKFRDKFNFRRGRVNCSLNDVGNWRWFGLQFSIKSN